VSVHGTMRFDSLLLSRCWDSISPVFAFLGGEGGNELSATKSMIEKLIYSLRSI
jgi:hypothetical protein